ncbi:DUF2975 domain-containing protein [Hwanghaeella grinnelliae]|nr:DUF2975 domain-containing protein [Hwanghaeella grinnelliae]
MTRYERITSTSKKLSFLCLALLCLLPFYLAHHWLLPTDLWFDQMPFGESTKYFDSWPPPPEQRALGILICFLPGFFMAKGLWHLKQLFALYSKGVFFSEATVRIYSRIATAAVLFVIIWMVSESLLSIAMSYHTASPELEISFDHTHALALFAALVMRVTAWIMSVGHNLNVENQSFV